LRAQGGVAPGGGDADDLDLRALQQQAKAKASSMSSPMSMSTMTFCGAACAITAHDSARTENSPRNGRARVEAM
jgi:hypothetical protein